MAINPETTTWVRELLQQELGKAIAPLRQEIDQVDDWANGVFVALQDVVDVLARHHPALEQQLLERWQPVAERHAQLGRQGQAEDFHETPGLLEARKMLYRLRMLERGGQPPRPGT